MTKKELQRLSMHDRPAELKTKVDAIANVIDEFQDQSPRVHQMNPQLLQVNFV